MKKLYLHIGESKTGSSAIQRSLQNLQEQGILKQHDFAILWKGVLQHINAAKSDTSSNEHLKILTDFLQNFVTNATVNNLIISCEIFSSKFFAEPENVAVFQRVFAGYDVKVLIYMRRQDRIIESAWAQSCKAFKSAPRPCLVDLRRKDLLDAYAAIFGKQNILVRIYDRKALYKNDSRADFFEWVGLQALIPMLEENTCTNPSLSPVNLRIRLSYMRQNRLSAEEKTRRCKDLETQLTQIKGVSAWELNQNLFIARHGINADSAFYKTLNKLLLHEKTPQKNTHAYVGLEKRKLYLESCKEENAAIAREYLGREDGILFDDEMPKETISLASPSTDDLVTSFLPIFVHLTQRIEALEEEVKRLNRVRNFCKGIILKLKKIFYRKHNQE